MLQADSAVLLIIDIQEKLFRVMHKKEELADNLQKLIKGIQVLGIPVIITEQYPRGLGSTIPEISHLLPESKPLPKVCFSCCTDEGFLQEFKKLNRKQILIAGIESHICVYQTAADLLAAGYEVYAVSDVISSRTEQNRDIGLKMMTQLGVKLTGTEAVLFELLKVAKGEKFKAISQIVR
jgi:nicotinamidase-related amidase